MYLTAVMCLIYRALLHRKRRLCVLLAVNMDTNVINEREHFKAAKQNAISSMFYDTEGNVKSKLSEQEGTQRLGTRCRLDMSATLSFRSTSGKFCGSKYFLRGPGSSVGIATYYRLDGPAIESQWGQDFPIVQTDSGAHPTSCTMGTGYFPGVKCGRVVLLSPHPLLVPCSWKSWVIPLPPSGPQPSL
jgi:hypothetical protein